MEVSGQLHAPAALPPGKEPPGVHRIEGCLGLRGSLDDMEKWKFLPPPGLDLQPVANGYTDCAISALSWYREVGLYTNAQHSGKGEQDTR
jgi:hypothetical protein